MPDLRLSRPDALERQRTRNRCGDAGPGLRERRLVIRALVAATDPVLRRVASGVPAYVVDLVGDLFDTMHAHNGIGLAAPQIGVSSRVAVIGMEGLSLVMIEPRVYWSSTELATEYEGCLSLPGVSELVTRPAEIRLAARTLEGQPYSMKLRKLAARAAQHEVDHLNGILIARPAGLPATHASP